MLMPDPYRDRGRRLGELVARKQREYGDSVGKSAGILRILYPAGIAPHQYDDVLSSFACSTSSRASGSANPIAMTSAARPPGRTSRDTGSSVGPKQNHRGR